MLFICTLYERTFFDIIIFRLEHIVILVFVTGPPLPSFQIKIHYHPANSVLKNEISFSGRRVSQVEFLLPHRIGANCVTGEWEQEVELLLLLAVSDWVGGVEWKDDDVIFKQENIPPFCNCVCCSVYLQKGFDSQYFFVFLQLVLVSFVVVGKSYPNQDYFILLELGG